MRNAQTTRIQSAFARAIVPDGSHPGVGSVEVRRITETPLEPGMTFAVEPMVTSGSGRVRQMPGDPWTVFTADRSLGAHFEHTIAVTEDGPKVLTVVPKEA